MAGRRGAAPRMLRFGVSTAQAGARPVHWSSVERLESRLSTLNKRLSTKMERLPGIAPGHSPWRRDILLLNHSREIQGRGTRWLRAHI